MIYSKKFEEDYVWFLKVGDKFNFDGNLNYLNKKGISIIQYSDTGLSAKECFFLYDSQGKIEKTCDVEGLKFLLRTKGSINLHIKMYAESRIDGSLPKMLFDEVVKELEAPEWFVSAVENQWRKIYSKNKEVL